MSVKEPQPRVPAADPGMEAEARPSRLARFARQDSKTRTLPGRETTVPAGRAAALWPTGRAMEGPARNEERG